jgi:hypothetical protein
MCGRNDGRGVPPFVVVLDCQLAWHVIRAMLSIPTHLTSQWNLMGVGMSEKHGSRKNFFFPFPRWKGEATD